MNNFYRGGRGLPFSDCNPFFKTTQLLNFKYAENQQLNEDLCSEDLESYSTYLASQIYEHQLRLKYASDEWEEKLNSDDNISLFNHCLDLILEFVSYFLNSFKISLKFSIVGILMMFFGFFLIHQVEGQTQGNAIMLGQKVPDDFWTKEHLFYINGDTVRKSLEEHKGKIIVLDFWMTGCTRCLLHQKDIQIYRNMYPDEILVLMVNSKKTKDNYSRIETLYNSSRFQNLGLKNLISIIEDTYLDSLFTHVGYPTYFWINSFGYLQTITFRNYLDHNYQPPFIDGK